MKRFAILMAAAALAGAAQAETSIYGLLDLSAGRFQAAGQQHQWKLESGQMSESYIGIKGTDEIAGTLKARFQLESFVRADVGATGRYVGDPFFGRDSFVGLQGEFGSTVLGRNTTPFFLATTSFNPFGDSFGFAPSVRHYFGGGVLLGDRSWDNSIAYTNPYDSALRVSLAANLGEGAPGSTGRNLGASFFHVAGPLAAGLALQRVRNSALPVPDGFDKQDAWQLGLTYDFGPLRAFGQVGGVKTSATVDERSTLYQLGASAPLGVGSLLVSYGDASTKRNDTRTHQHTFSIGYDYSLSKNTDLYAVYMNDRASGLATGHTLATGVRLRF
jgi:predicted porin